MAPLAEQDGRRKGRFRLFGSAKGDISIGGGAMFARYKDLKTLKAVVSGTKDIEADLGHVSRPKSGTYFAIQYKFREGRPDMSRTAAASVLISALVTTLRCRTSSSVKTAGLAGVTDPKRFTAEFQLLKNPHVTASARYLAERTASPAPAGDVTAQAYPLQAALWPSPAIAICWENPGPGFAPQMSQVQQAIAGTWQQAPRLEFTGWAQCPATPDATQQVIRILIADTAEAPRTLGLGRQLSGRPNGLSLNFSFLNWGSSCLNMRDYCTKAIAVHEFGHAIGFAHEQNRPDAPEDCMQPVQGPNGDDVLLTPYDRDSVMNYCNQKYNNEGNLSALDKAAVKALYGER